ncbi:uncharacterized protein N7525_010436 [Penicillium rubens]|uniref:uncharacterized protein n=1 Tax=Penicillium rubens TaxID=1108849 RepID=UPI002A5AFFD5|nr:uncharacterized protein N7525_010436 [Penicillium rubens]KAJ5821152.1 hypothetical protein N7525_010436 [Penicillium rubens]
MSISSFDPRHYSLDGPNEAPEGHHSSSVSRGRRVTRTRHDTHSRQSTRQRSSANESSQHAPPPPQIPRTPAIRTLRETSPTSPTPSISGSSWDEYVSDDTVTRYRTIGAQYQAWIAGPTATECPIRRSRVTWTDLVDHPIEEYSFEVYLNEIRSTPEEAGNLELAGLSMGDVWRYVFLRRYGYWDAGRQAGYTIYQHRTGLGAIFVENITRRFGPYWAQVAQAQYQLDNHIDTLRTCAHGPTWNSIYTLVMACTGMMTMGPSAGHMVRESIRSSWERSWEGGGSSGSGGLAERNAPH